jgi:hypothetical protein
MLKFKNPTLSHISKGCFITASILKIILFSMYTFSTATKIIFYNSKAALSFATETNYANTDKILILFIEQPQF